MLAVAEGQVDCLQTLVENNVNLTAESSKKYDPWIDDKPEDYGVFALSVVHDQLKSLEYLFSLGEDLWKSLEKHDSYRCAKIRGTVTGLAAKLGRTECLRLLLEHGLGSNEQLDNHNHAICLAVEGGQSESLDLLIEYDMHSYVLGNFESSVVEQKALFLAALNGHENMLRSLYECGFKIFFTHGNTSALHGAAGHGHVGCLKFCIEKCKEQGGILGHIDAVHDTPLRLASRRGHSKCVEILIKSATLVRRPFNGLIGAAEHKHVCMSCQKEQRCVCYDKDEFCWDQGSCCRHPVCLYGKSGWDDRSRCKGTCKQDCNCNMAETIKILYAQTVAWYRKKRGENCPPPAKIVSKALEACVWNDEADALKWLLSEGANPMEIIDLPSEPWEEDDGKKMYPIFYAMEVDARKCFRVLLEYGKTFLPEKPPIDRKVNNIDIYIDRGETLLYAAIHLDRENALSPIYVRMLLEHGVDPNERVDDLPIDWCEYSPAILEAICRDCEDLSCTKVLLEHGVSAYLHEDEFDEFEFTYRYFNGYVASSLEKA